MSPTQQLITEHHSPYWEGGREKPGRGEILKEIRQNTGLQDALMVGQGRRGGRQKQRHMAGTGRLHLEMGERAWEVGMQVLEQQNLASLPHCLIPDEAGNVGPYYSSSGAWLRVCP